RNVQSRNRVNVNPLKIVKLLRLTHLAGVDSGLVDEGAEEAGIETPYMAGRGDRAGDIAQAGKVGHRPLVRAALAEHQASLLLELANGGERQRPSAAAGVNVVR